MNPQDVILGIASTCFTLGMAVGIVFGMWGTVRLKDCETCRKVDEAKR